MFPLVLPNPRKPRRRPDQLPPGRHGLARDFVIENQRERIMVAVAEVVSEQDYGSASVEDIIKAAGLSRRTFYDHFKNKEEAFLASFDSVSGELMRDVYAAFGAAEGFVDRVVDCLTAFLGFVSERPIYAHMCIVEVLAAGPEAIERRNTLMSAFAALFDRAAKEEKGTLRTPPLVSEIIVGGIYEVVYARVLRGEVESLPELHPDFVYSALLPYVGPDETQATYKRLSRRKPRARKTGSARA